MADEEVIIANNTRKKTVTITGLKQDMSYDEFAQFKSLIDSAMESIPKEVTHIFVEDINYWLPRY